MMPENLLDKEYTVCAIGSCHCVTHIMFFRDVTPVVLNTRWHFGRL